MRHILICLALTLISFQTFGGVYYVGTQAGTGAGTIGNPWNATQGCAGSGVVGGDTIYWRAGTYTRAIFDLLPSGSSNASPVIYRNYNNEVIVWKNNDPTEWTLLQRGNYLWVWGIEIYNDLQPSNETALTVQSGIGSRLINCYIHDSQTLGVSSLQVAGTHVYGNIINYSGRHYWAPSGEGPGYGWYGQNLLANPVRKYFNDNIVAFSWSWGTHFSTVGGSLDSITMEGNAVYGSGLFWRYPNWGTQSIYGGEAPPTVTRYFQENNNVFYQGLERTGGGNYMGLYVGSFSIATLTGNYFISNTSALTLENDGGSNTITGNVFIGGTSGVSATYPSNTFITSGWPSARADDIIVRKNAYESNRAHIYILNYDESATVSVNPNANGTVLNSGDSYVVKDGLNYTGANVASGTWTSGNITIPMTGLPTPATPIMPPAGMGQQEPMWLPANGGPGGPPPHTAPRFATFVLIGTAGSSAGRNLQFIR